MEAHTALESITLDRDTIQYKHLVSERYAELVYNGMWFSSLKEALDAFIDRTQETVNGTVRVKLYKGSATPLGVESPFSLYSEDLATFGASAAFDHADSRGFVKLYGLPGAVASSQGRS